MVSLIDIGQIRGNVKLRGVDLPVQGITAEDMVMLFQAYPDLRKLVAGRADADVLQTLVNQFPMTVADIIAIGTGTEYNGTDWDAAVSVARKLAVGEQFAILQEIGRITFPQGAKSFLDGVAAAVGIEPVTLGWAQALKSPQPSPDASQQDGTKEPVGEAHPAS